MADAILTAPSSESQKIEQALADLNDTLDRTLTEVEKRQQRIDRYARESDEVLARLMTR